MAQNTTKNLIELLAIRTTDRLRLVAQGHISGSFCL